MSAILKERYFRIQERYRYLKQNENFRKGTLYTFFSFLNNGISFLLILILAGYLLPSDYGYLNLYNTFITIIGIVICLGTSTYVSNSFFLRTRDDFHRVINTVLISTTTMLLLMSLCLFFYPGKISSVIGVPVEVIWIALLICFFQIVSNINLDLWRLEENPKSYGLYSLSVSIINFIITFIFIICLKKGWIGRVYAQLIVSSVFFCISIVYLIKRQYCKLILPTKKIIKETFLFSLPLIPHALSYWLKQGSDRYIVNYYWDAEAVGLYSFAMNFASIINIVGNAFNAHNSVYIYKLLKGGINQALPSIKQIRKIMTLVFLLVNILIFLLCYGSIPYLFPKYISSTKLLFPLLLGAFFQCLYLLNVNILFYFNKTVQLMYITSVTAIIQIALSLILTKYNIIYTAYISMAVSLITCWIIYRFSNKILASRIMYQNYCRECNKL